MKTPEHIRLSHRARKRVHKQLILIACITVTPSIYLAYQTTQTSIRESHVNTYISECFNFPNTDVIQTNINDETNTIEVALLGQTIDNKTIQDLNRKLGEYNLDGMSLKVTQTETSSNTDNEKLKELIQNLINNNVDINSFKDFMNKTNTIEENTTNTIIDFNKVSKSIQSLYPNVNGCYMGYVNQYFNMDSISTDTLIVVLNTSTKLSNEDYSKIQTLLSIQFENDDFILLENPLNEEVITDETTVEVTEDTSVSSSISESDETIETTT